MIKKIKCKNQECRSIIVDNSEKHQNREKYCPKCRTAYKKPRGALKIDLNWLNIRQQKQLEKEKLKETKRNQEKNPPLFFSSIMAAMKNVSKGRRRQ